MNDTKQNQVGLLPMKHVLQSYTKTKLDHMRRVWDIKGISQLNKADLIDALTIAIPQRIEHQSSKWDVNVLQIAKKMVANNGVIKSEGIPMENIRYLLDHAIICEIENGKQLLMPYEVMVRFQGLMDHLEVHRIAKRNQEWHQLTLGLLHYYGTLQVSQLFDLIASYTDYPTEMDDFIGVIFEARAFHADFTFDQYGFSDLLVLNPSWVVQEHKKRPDLSFYPFSKQAILQASDDAFVDRNKHYRSFVRFLTKNYEIDHEEADEIVSECVVDIKLGLTPTDLLSSFSKRFEFASFAEVQPFMDQVLALFNNTREWILKGHTSIELRPQEEKHLQLLPDAKATNKTSVTGKKIGRNDPCPCGSGKKYKKCCGK